MEIDKGQLMYCTVGGLLISTLCLEDITNGNISVACEKVVVYSIAWALAYPVGSWVYDQFSKKGLIKSSERENHGR